MLHTLGPKNRATMRDHFSCRFFLLSHETFGITVPPVRVLFTRHALDVVDNVARHVGGDGRRLVIPPTDRSQTTPGVLCALWVFVVLSFPPDVLHLECQCDATSAKSLPPPGCWLAGSSEMVGAFPFLGAPLACRCFLIIRCELLRTWFWSTNIYRGVQHCWLLVLGLLFQSQEIWRESLIGAICYRSGSL